MKRYIYGKPSSDTALQAEKNDFHSLSMYLGAFLFYLEDPTCKDFDNYIREHNLLYDPDSKNSFWSYVNKGHSFILKKIKNSESFVSEKSANKLPPISHRQIKRLGYSGVLSVRRFPINGVSIQNMIFRYVFTEAEMKTLKNAYLNYVYAKWLNDPRPNTFLSSEGNESAVENTFSWFLDFQDELLSSSPKGIGIRQKLFENNTYQVIQHEMDKRSGGSAGQ